MKIRKITAVSAILFIMLFAQHAAAQDKEGLIPRLWKKIAGKKGSVRASPAPAASPAVPAQSKPLVDLSKTMPDMSREDMIQEIEFDMESYDGLIDKIPEIKKRKDADDKDKYVYLQDGKDVNLEDIEPDKLKELLNKVYTQVNLNQAKMVAEQMEVIRESQRASMVQQQISHMPPPLPVRPPAPPPQPPRAPSPPPQALRR